MAWTWVIGFVWLLAPALVLTLHPQKQEIVINALVPGVILLVIALWTAIKPAEAGLLLREASGGQVGGGQLRARLGLADSAALWFVARGTMIAALVFFSHRQRVPVETAEAMENFRQVNTLADYIFTRGQEAKLSPIRVSVDFITDALDAQVLRVVCYERHHVWRDFDMKLPTGIAEPDAAEVRQRVADSDFVFLTGDDFTHLGYPFDRKLAALRPELRAWCDAHLRLTRTFTFSGHPILLYERVTAAQ